MSPFTIANLRNAPWRAASIAIAMLVAMPPITLAPASAQTIDPPSVSSAANHPYGLHVADAARRFGIPESWIWAVMRVESAGDSRAVSRAGAMGLMQIMPGTWAQLRVRHGLGFDPFDVRDNIMAGAAYLREMYDRYGNVSAMLAAYNAGPGRYDEHLRGRPLPAETRSYLARLASIAGDTGDTQLAAAPPPDPFAWRRSGLFVRVARAPDTLASAPPDSENAAPNSSADAPSPSGIGARESATAPTQSAPTDTLFVRRAGGGRPQ